MQHRATAAPVIEGMHVEHSEPEQAQRLPIIPRPVRSLHRSVRVILCARVRRVSVCVGVCVCVCVGVCEHAKLYLHACCGGGAYVFRLGHAQTQPVLTVVLLARSKTTQGYQARVVLSAHTCLLLGCLLSWERISSSWTPSTERHQPGTAGRTARERRWWWRRSGRRTAST